jgi:PKD repeat protein
LVSFDAGRSYDPGGSQIVAQWTFDDGTTATGLTAVHGFSSPGDHTVRVSIANEMGSTATAEVTISVSQPLDEVGSSVAFDAQAGTQFDSGLGLAVDVPPSLESGQLTLVVTYDPTPTLLEGAGVNALATYSVSLVEDKAGTRSGSSLRHRDGTQGLVYMKFQIPTAIPTDKALVLQFTDRGWALACSKDTFNVFTKVGGSLTGTFLLVTQPATALYLETTRFAICNRDEIERVIAHFVSSLDASPVYPEVSDMPGPTGQGGHTFLLRSPLREVGGAVGTGGVWFKVSATASAGASCTWEPALKKDPLTEALPGWYLRPTAAGNEGVLTVQYDQTTGGTVSVVLDARAAMGVQLMDVVVSAIPFGSMGEAGISAFTDSLRRRLDAAMSSGSLSLRDTPRFLAWVLESLVEGFNAMKGKATEEAIQEAAKGALAPISLCFTGANIAMYAWTLLSAQGGQCSHGTCTYHYTWTPSNKPPIANGVASAASVTVGTLVTLDGSSSSDPEGKSLTYSWKQVAGPSVTLTASVSSPEASFTPSNTGTYQFSLVVNDGSLNSEPSHVTVTVADQPVSGSLARYSAAPQQVQVGQSVTLSATVTNTSSAPWTFYVALSLKKPNGSQVNLDLRPLTLNAGQQGTATWSYVPDAVGGWDVYFGVWKEQAEQNSLAATGWLSDYLVVSSQPSTPPVCSVSANPTYGTAPLAVTFTMSASGTNGASISSWKLDANGDGVADFSGNGSPPATRSYTYNSQGNYIVALVVTDSRGTPASASATVNVGASYPQPTCSLSANPSSGPAPLTVTFTMSASATGGTITTWVFRPGDGSADSSGTGSPPPSTLTHTYASPSTYTAVLAVGDSHDGSAMAPQTIVVTSPQPSTPPVCSVSANPTYGTAPLAVTFTMSASGTNGASISSWKLDANGDGVADFSGNGSPPATRSYTYNSQGNYIVALVVTDSRGTPASASATVNVGASYPQPTCSLSANPSSGPAPLTVTFTMSASATGGTITTWVFRPGDGSADSSGTGSPPPSTLTHTYASPSTYTAVLAVGDSHDGSAMAPQTIVVTQLAQKFAIGDRVQVYNSGSLWLYANPCGTRLYPDRKDGDTGVILDGPVFCYSYNRWRVQWNDGVVGWSAEDWLRKI